MNVKTVLVSVSLLRKNCGPHTMIWLWPCQATFTRAKVGGALEKRLTHPPGMLGACGRASGISKIIISRSEPETMNGRHRTFSSVRCDSCVLHLCPVSVMMATSYPLLDSARLTETKTAERRLTLDLISLCVALRRPLISTNVSVLWPKGQKLALIRQSVRILHKIGHLQGQRFHQISDTAATRRDLNGASRPCL